MKSPDDWNLLDHGFDAQAKVQTSRGWIAASELVPEDRLITPLGEVALLAVYKTQRRQIVQLSNAEHRLIVAPGQLVHCSHWACLPLIGCQTAALPAAALTRGGERARQEGGVTLVRLTPTKPAVIEVQGFQLALVNAGAILGLDWQGLASPFELAPNLCLADPNSLRQLDSAGIATRSSKLVKYQDDSVPDARQLLSETQ